jgi:hypothetical protein
MRIDAHILTLLIVTTCVGWLMLRTGVGKNMLEWRRQRRVCPSCGRALDGAGCSCSSV